MVVVDTEEEEEVDTEKEYKYVSALVFNTQIGRKRRTSYLI